MGTAGQVQTSPGVESPGAWQDTPVGWDLAPRVTFPRPACVGHAVDPLRGGTRGQTKASLDFHRSPRTPLLKALRPQDQDPHRILLGTKPRPDEGAGSCGHGGDNSQASAVAAPGPGKQQGLRAHFSRPLSPALRLPSPFLPPPLKGPSPPPRGLLLSPQPAGSLLPPPWLSKHTSACLESGL